MKSSIKSNVVLRRALTISELERLKIISDTDNVMRSCAHAGITHKTWMRIYKHNGVTKTTTIASLLEYADVVKKVADKQLNAA